MPKSEVKPDGGGTPVWRRAIRLAGSTWLGVAMIGLLAAYLSLASTAPGAVAAALAAEPEDLYRHWLPVALWSAVVVSLAVATVTRIPLRWSRLGAWCSHLGVVVLAAGAVIYALAGISGESLALRTDGGWTPIRHVYIPRTLAAYVYGREGAIGQTPLGRLGPRSGPTRLDVSLDSPERDVEVRALEYVLAGRIVARWADDSPNPVPAVELRITDGGESAVVLLSRSIPDFEHFAGQGYVIVYHAQTSKTGLERFISPGDANQGPGMAHDLALILTGPEVPATLAVVRPDGSRWHAKLEALQAVDVPLAGRMVRVEPLRFLQHAARVYELQAPGPAPPAPASPSAPAEADSGEVVAEGPALKVQVRVGTWQRQTWAPMIAFEDLGSPQVMDLPGGRAIALGFSRRRVPLPATLQIASAEYQTWPGSVVPRDYRCDVEVASGGVQRRDTLSLNHPVRVGAFQFSQGSWREDPSRPSAIFLSAASRPGLFIIWAGCILICLGLPVAFYLKPLLLRREGGS